MPDDKEWAAMLGCLKEKHVAQHEVYLREGDVCRKASFIVQGGFRMYYIIDGEEISKDFQFEGQFTGSRASMISGEPARFNIAALEDSLLLEISKAALDELCDKYWVWDRLVRMYMEQIFLYKEKRETSFLLDSPAVRYQNMLDEYPGHIQRIPQKHIATYLGIKPETLSRIRKQRS